MVYLICMILELCLSRLVSSQHISTTQNPAHSTEADCSVHSHCCTGDTESELLTDSEVNQIESVSVCL